MATQLSDCAFASMVALIVHPSSVTEALLCTVPTKPPIFFPFVPNFRYPLNEQFSIVSLHPLCTNPTNPPTDFVAPACSFIVTSLILILESFTSTLSLLREWRVCDLLGHSTTQVTEMYYVKKDNKMLGGITDEFCL